MKRNRLKLISAAALMLAASGLALAQQPVKLRYGTHLGPKAPGVLEGVNVFAEHVKTLSKGTLDVEVYPSEQAGKALQMFDLVRSGAVDVGSIASAYISSDKSPLLGIMEIPGLAKSVCGISTVLRKHALPGGVIYETELKPAGMRLLAINPYPPYGPAASRNPINKVEDLKGMKMRVAGGLMELTAQKLGGVPVKLPSTEVYQALQRGTLDTVLFSFLSVKEYDLASITKYGATGYSWGTPGDTILISERRLQAMTKEQQDAVIEAGRRTTEHWCKYVDEKEAQFQAEARAAGMNIHTWTAADVAKLNALTAEVPNEWAKTLDGRGKPASKLLQEVRAELAK
jgi:TRAP-type C4-dicarboxylate transport system substrate-binding protein